ncbi:MAG: DUF1015 domain-containing protein, partial [Desulfobacterales bacterium]|nr:DUF1015 domain-containing protein [Desulfobacterales bacterium]
MANKTIFIADGHHRYETALNYKNWVKENTPDFGEDHPANNIMMYLSGIQDPGLIILPAHRMVNHIEKSDDFIEKSKQYFEIKTTPSLPEFLSLLEILSNQNAIGVFIKNDENFYILTLKPNIMESMFGQELPQSMRELDVTVLTRLILMEMLGFDQTKLDDEKLITYTRDVEEALLNVKSGKCAIAFINNPTKIEQVKAISEQGLIMPRKSTYFYPKVITGLVLNKL